MLVAGSLLGSPSCFIASSHSVRSFAGAPSSSGGRTDSTLLEVDSDVAIRIDCLLGLRFVFDRHALEIVSLSLFNRRFKNRNERPGSWDGQVHAALLQLWLTVIVLNPVVLGNYKVIFYHSSAYDVPTE